MSPKQNYLQRNLANPEVAKLREQLKSIAMREAMDVAFAEYTMSVCQAEGAQSSVLAGAKIDGARRFMAVLLTIAEANEKPARPDTGRLLQEGEKP